MHRGSCLCGAVCFEVDGELTPPDACHCSQCRKVSGHYWASTDVPRSKVTIKGKDELGWFRSSEKVRRGFCKTCGSPLFWDVDGRTNLSISMGAFDQPTMTRLEKHIFVPDKGDYYQIADGLPQFGSSPGEQL
jgi:hypothetical protein